MNQKENMGRLPEVTAVRPTTTARKRKLLENIAAYIDAHITEKVRLKEVALYCGVSVSTITQMFKTTDTTFHGILTERRLLAAEKLIRTGMPIVEIGPKVGYTDHSSFHRAFKMYYGIPPREYRKRLLQEMKAQTVPYIFVPL